MDKPAQWASRGAGLGGRRTGEPASAPGADRAPWGTGRSGSTESLTGLELDRGRDPPAVRRACKQIWTGFAKKTPVRPHVPFIGARAAGAAIPEGLSPSPPNVVRVGEGVTATLTMGGSSDGEALRGRPGSQQLVQVRSPPRPPERREHPSLDPSCWGRQLGRGSAGRGSSGLQCPVLAPQAGMCVQEALAKLHLRLAAL